MYHIHELLNLNMLRVRDIDFQQASSFVGGELVHDALVEQSPYSYTVMSLLRIESDSVNVQLKELSHTAA